MPINTKFDPPNLNYFDKTKMNKDARGVSATVTAGTTVSLDYTLADDILLAGGTTFLAKGGAQGDTVDFQVVHPVAGVLNQFISNWYVNPDVTDQTVPPSNYPAKLFSGLILRIVYHSTGASDVWIAVNYNMEKVLE
jgi:hypothetical protein